MTASYDLPDTDDATEVLLLRRLVRLAYGGNSPTLAALRRQAAAVSVWEPALQRALTARTDLPVQQAPQRAKRELNDRRLAPRREADRLVHYATQALLGAVLACDDKHDSPEQTRDALDNLQAALAIYRQAAAR